ncbi:MAG: family 16 glycoside hydrolase [Planctomycetota bacterium]
MRRRWSVGALASALALGAGGLSAQTSQPAAVAADGWRPLFDGRSLDGWHRVGGAATFEVREGMIVGSTTTGQPNAFLRTDVEYGDFELELDVWIDPALNSGIQIRSHVRPKSGRVYGLQVEVDPSDRAWSGGIYDEARRGWLADLADAPAAREAFRGGGTWNHYRVRCVGAEILTWVNGEPAARLLDGVDLTGFIALQVHGIGKDEAKAGRPVRWRNVRIRELGRHAWRPLWNGRNLAGWVSVGDGFAVEDGVLIGSGVAALVATPGAGARGLRLRLGAVRGAGAAVAFGGAWAGTGPMQGGTRLALPDGDGPLACTLVVNALGETAAWLDDQRTELAPLASGADELGSVALVLGADTEVRVQALEQLVPVRR